MSTTYTTREAADVLGVSEDTVRRAIEQGTLPASRPGGSPRAHYRIRRADLDTYRLAAGKSGKLPGDLRRAVQKLRADVDALRRDFDGAGQLDVQVDREILQAGVRYSMNPRDEHRAEQLVRRGLMKHADGGYTTTELGEEHLRAAPSFTDIGCPPSAEMVDECLAENGYPDPPGRDLFECEVEKDRAWDGQYRCGIHDVWFRTDGERPEVCPAGQAVLDAAGAFVDFESLAEIESLRRLLNEERDKSRRASQTLIAVVGAEAREDIEVTAAAVVRAFEKLEEP